MLSTDLGRVQNIQLGQANAQPGQLPEPQDSATAKSVAASVRCCDHVFTV